MSAHIYFSNIPSDMKYCFQPIHHFSIVQYGYKRPFIKRKHKFCSVVLIISMVLVFSMVSSKTSAGSNSGVFPHSSRAAEELGLSVYLPWFSHANRLPNPIMNS